MRRRVARSRDRGDDGVAELHDVSVGKGLVLELHARPFR